LQTAYQEKGVVWLTICSSAPGKQGYYHDEHLSEAIAANDWKGSAYLIDADGDVGRTYQAKTTPNMYVIDPGGKLIYAGAIDDKPTVKQAEVKGAVNYVKLALNASMADKPVEVAATQPYGCSVKYAR
jgi:hypothetical protein